MGRLGKIIAGISAVVAFIGTLAVAILNSDAVFQRFGGGDQSPTERTHQASLSPDAPVVRQSDSPRSDDPLSDRLARDLRKHLTVGDCPDSVLTVTAIAPEHLSPEQTSHGFQSTFLAASLRLEVNSKIAELRAIGNGRGPASDIEAYDSLLRNALGELSATDPDCFCASPATIAAITSSASPSARPSPSGDTHYSTDVFEADVVGLYYAPSTGEATWSLGFTNTSENAVGLAYVPASAAIAVGTGGTMELGDKWSGLRTCYSPSNLQFCNTSDARYATTLAPGKFAQLNFDAIGAKDLSDPALTLTMEMVVTPDTSDTAAYDVRSVGFFDLVPVSR